MPSERYKIKAPDNERFQEALAQLRSSGVAIFVTSERRNTASTAALPKSLATSLRSRGFTVAPEFQYDLEATGGRS